MKMRVKGMARKNARMRMAMAAPFLIVLVLVVNFYGGLMAEA